MKRHPKGTGEQLIEKERGKKDPVCTPPFRKLKLCLPYTKNILKRRPNHKKAESHRQRLLDPLPRLLGCHGASSLWAWLAQEGVGLGGPSGGAQATLSDPLSLSGVNYISGALTAVPALMPQE